ncbi:MAG: hypothetical protein DKINENOH_04531 [bacterium]|nr:hypothetical protein [bacterium]
MSEAITGGIAAGAVAACAAAVGVVVGVGYGAYRGLTWLSEQAQLEAERLERELAIPLPTHVTSNEARQQLSERFAVIQKNAKQNRLLAPQGDAIARILALRTSPLGSFLRDSDWNKFCTAPPSVNVFQNVLRKASKNFAFANAVLVAQSVVEVAVKEGFAHQRVSQAGEEKQILVLEDTEGRALVAEVYPSDDGARINLDLTGFGDGTCHTVMDKILKGLAQKDIRLNNVHRRSHFRREGETESARKYWHSPAKQRHNISGSRRSQAHDELRRRQGLAAIRAKKIN